MSIWSIWSRLDNHRQCINNHTSEITELRKDLDALLNHLGLKVVRSHNPETITRKVVKKCKKCKCELGSDAVQYTQNYPFGSSYMCACDCHTKKKGKKHG